MEALSSRRTAGYRQVGVSLVVFYLVNISVFIAVSALPDLINWLRLSADRPWGIVTSAFAHVELDHLASNLEGFLMAALLFVIINQVKSIGWRRCWSRAFLWVTLLAGIGANLLEYPLALLHPEDSSWGASGIVYAAIGVVLAAAILNMPANLLAIKKERRRRARLKRAGRTLRFDRRFWSNLPHLLPLAFIATIVIMILVDPAGFLNDVPGVDVFAHGVGFLLGFIGFSLRQRFGSRCKLAKGSLSFKFTSLRR